MNRELGEKVESQMGTITELQIEVTDLREQLIEGPVHRFGDGQAPPLSLELDSAGAMDVQEAVTEVSIS